jgi:hypothetical protein
VTNKNYVSKKNAVEVKLYIKKANFNNVTISIAKFSTYNNRLLLAPGYDIQQFDIILNDLPEELYNDTTITYTLTTPINKCLLVNNGPKKVALKVLDGLTHGQAFIFSISVTLTNPNYSSKTITKNNFEIYVSDFVSEKIFTISFWPPGSQY